MDDPRLARLRRKHKRLPPDERRRRGPAPVVGPQRPLVIGAATHACLVKLACGGSLGAVARQAYALGRSAIMARLSAGDRWDTCDHKGGRGELKSIGLPMSYIRGWPPLACSHGAACRLALDVGLELLEFEFARHGFVELLDERTVDPIAAQHHPERYCTPEPWTGGSFEPTVERLRAGTTWQG
jgi:hypothetical protein